MYKQKGAIWGYGFEKEKIFSFADKNTAAFTICCYHSDNDLRNNIIKSDITDYAAENQPFKYEYG